MLKFFSFLAFVASSTAVVQNGAPITTLDGTAIAHRYDGHGGLSAGASSRLLYDYPEQQRNEVLDYLFKPSFGMNLAQLKIEIGGDTQSTDGTEPSHMHTRDDYSCDRGFELFLAAEAKKRNPSIALFALSWGVPAWIGNDTFFSTDNINYQTKFAQCVLEKTSFPLDYIGCWNERQCDDVEYIIQLRASLDAAGFNNTEIVLPDGGYDTTILQNTVLNQTYSDAWNVMGLHYPCPRGSDPYSHPTPHDLGKKFWASEDWWSQPDWPSAAAWGRMLNQRYVVANMTAVIAWSPLWSVYNGLPDEQAGLMLASTPWSGTYDISPPIWTSAHWGQFTFAGWHFLSTSTTGGGGGSGWLPGNGTYVSVVDPQNPAGNFTLILETFISGGRCPTDHPVPATQTVTFALSGGLPSPGTSLAVWSTNETHQFLQLPDIVVGNDNTFQITIAPDSMMTISTIHTASKGAPNSPIPAWTPFPLPYFDSFDESAYPYDGMGKYFADQFGSFATRNGSLVQVGVGNPAANAWVTDADPATIIGDVNWTDISVGVMARWEGVVAGVAEEEVSSSSSSSSSSGNSGSNGARRTTTISRAGGTGLRDGQPGVLFPCDATSPFQIWEWNVTGVGYLSNDPGIAYGWSRAMAKQQLQQSKSEGDGSRSRSRRRGIQQKEQQVSLTSTSPFDSIQRRQLQHSQLLAEAGNNKSVTSSSSSSSSSLSVPSLSTASPYLQCFNVYGCQTNIVYWSCVTTGGTCCGGDCYQNLQWTLDSTTGALISSLPGNMCATIDESGHGPMTLEKCGAGMKEPEGGASSPSSSSSAMTTIKTLLPANQSWSYDQTTGLVKHQASGLCLGQTAPPQPRAYVQICARLGSAAWGEKVATPYGYCLVVGDPDTLSITSANNNKNNQNKNNANRTQMWTITIAQSNVDGSAQILANGTLPADFNISAWHMLNISVTGSGKNQTPQREGAQKQTRATTTTTSGNAGGIFVTAFVDGVEVTPAGGVNDPTGRYEAGLALVGSGYHPAYFDDFSVVAASTTAR